MCDLFKPKDAPAMTAAQEKAAAAQDQMIIDQQSALDSSKTADKLKRTQDLIARSGGLYGMRSLISGQAGGSGFLAKKAG